MNKELYAFVKAVSLIAMYVAAFSFGVLVFTFIDKFAPDPLASGFYQRALATPLAALIVAFPLYGVLMYFLGKAEKKDATLHQSKVAKWLVYITLVVVAGIIIGDLVALVASFLSGGLTSRFVLKALTVMAIAVSIFVYYLWSLQLRDEKKNNLIRVFGGVVLLAVVIAVIYGLTLIGTPSQQRAFQYDERRVSDLQQISFAIDDYWQQNNELPITLDDLRDRRFFVQSLTDPTNEPYEYNVLSEETYELCAVFALESIPTPKPLPQPVSEQLWEHGVGQTCFELEVRKPTVLPR